MHRVETAFRDRGLRCDVLILSPRLSLSAVVRRQIVEGVLAIVRLSRSNIYSGKIPLQVFDRTGGMDNVRFNGMLLTSSYIFKLVVATNTFIEYSELDVNVAAEVVLHARNTQQVNISSRSQPPVLPAAMVHPIVQQNPVQLAEQNHVAQVLSTLDGPTLNSLLNSLQANRPVPALNYSASSSVNHTDLSALLANITRQNNPIASIPTTQPFFQGTQPGGAVPNQPLAPEANLASLLAKSFGEPQMLQQPQQPTYPQLHQIMDQLSRWNR